MSWQKHEPYHHAVAFLFVSNCRLPQASYYVLNRLPYPYHKSGRIIQIFQHRYKQSLRCRNCQTCFHQSGSKPSLLEINSSFSHFFFICSMVKNGFSFLSSMAISSLVKWKLSSPYLRSQRRNLSLIHI